MARAAPATSTAAHLRTAIGDARARPDVLRRDDAQPVLATAHVKFGHTGSAKGHF